MTAASCCTPQTLPSGWLSPAFLEPSVFLVISYSYFVWNYGGEVSQICFSMYNGLIKLFFGQFRLRVKTNSRELRLSLRIERWEFKTNI